MSRFMRWIPLLIALCGASAAYGQGLAAIQNHCFQGGTQAKTSGLSSTNFQQGIIPSCTVTVYLTGTQTKATIFSNVTGTPLANPFTANATSSADPGGWTFWSAVNVGYDVVMSGGIAPNTYSTPVTLTDQYPSFSFSGSGGGGATPCGTSGQVQTANTSGSALNCDPNFFIDPVAHTFNSGGNMLVNALSSVPRAIYDPMNTKYDGGLAAAIAGTSGFTPTQVIQAAIDDGECQILTGASKYPAIDVPLPASVTMNITGIKLWPNTALHGENISTAPLLQHVDATQYMISSHVSTDTITCNGTVYTPGAPGGGVYIHDLRIAGLFNPNTDTDVGIVLNASSSVVENIAGGGSAFGGPAVIANGLTDFMHNIGYQGSQVQGCMTYNSGVRPVSDFGGLCGSVFDGSEDGGTDNVYASDGVASLNSNHAAGPCYPNCAAFIASANGGRASNLFLQVSSVGLIVNAATEKISTVRIDYMSREGIRFNFGSAFIDDLVMQNVCTDTALQANYNAGTATGCFGVNVGTFSASIYGVSAFNGAGIFPQGFMQAAVFDGKIGLSGSPNGYLFGPILGNPLNTTANDWLILASTNSNVGPQVFFPDRAPYQVSANVSTVNVNGLTNLWFTGTNQTITNFTGGIAGQHLYVQGNATIKNNTNVQNLNGLDNVLTCAATSYCFNVFEYISTGTSWVQIAGPPSQTPTHVNYSGNATPSNPSLLDVYGNSQARQIPGFSLGSQVQLHGPNAASGQACFVQEELFSDGSHVVSSQTCTLVDLSTQTPGSIFVAVTPEPGAIINLWMVSNTEPNGIHVGKFAAYTCSGSCFWDGPTTIAGGGDGTTPPTPGDNNTGEFWGVGSKQTCPNPLPACSQEYVSMSCTVPGSGSTPDINQICSYQGGGTYAWQPLGGGSASGTTNNFAMFTSTSTVGNAPGWTYNSGTNTTNVGSKISQNDGTGNGGTWAPGEGTQPGTAGTGVDSCYADSTAHALLCSFNNGTYKQVPLYTTGTNSPPLQWTSFNSTTFAGTNNNGIGSILQTATPSSTATVTRADMVLSTAPAGCTTQAVTTLYDETTPASPVEVSASLEITLANGTRFYNATPGSPIALTAGHQYMWGILTAAAGCSTAPAGPSWTVTYTIK